MAFELDESKKTNMSTLDAVEKFAHLAPVLADIIDAVKDNTEVINWLKTSQSAKSKADITLGLMRLFPTVYRLCGQSIFELIAICGARTVEEVKAQPLADTIQQLKDMIFDSDLRAFFSSSSAKGAGETTSDT